MPSRGPPIHLSVGRTPVPVGASVAAQVHHRLTIIDHCSSLKTADSEESLMTDSLTKRDEPDRSKINMNQDYEVQYWTKHLTAKEERQKIVDKAGNSAAAVRKELLAV